MSTNNQYTTPLTVKLFSQIQYPQLSFASDSDFDSFIQQALIPSAMRKIDNFCLHNFQFNANITITLDGRGKRVLFIPPPYVPVISLSALSINGVAQTLSNFVVYPTFIRNNAGCFYASPALGRNVSITLTHGFTAIPEDVSEACSVLCGNALVEMVRRKMMPDLIAKSMAAGASSMQAGALLNNAAVFTDDIKDTLRPYIYSYFELT